MKQGTIPYIIIFLLFISLQGKSQGSTNNGFSQWSGLVQVKENHPHYSFRNKTNELSVFFTGMFIFYKSFISSQDGNSCTFTPSCSEYALQSIEKYGVVKGMLSAFDRLTRCNGLSRELYPIDPVTHLFYDPVE